MNDCVPCPICGCERIGAKWEAYNVERVHMYCENCGHTSSVREKLHEAIFDWNWEATAKERQQYQGVMHV